LQNSGDFVKKNKIWQIMEKHFRTIFWCQNKDSRLKKCENSSQNSQKQTPPIWLNVSFWQIIVKWQ